MSCVTNSTVVRRSAAHLQQVVLQFLARDRVERRERLVQQQQRRLAGSARAPAPRGSAGRPTAAAGSAARARPGRAAPAAAAPCRSRCAVGRCCSDTGSSTLSITRCHSSRVGDWNTKPSCGPGASTSLPCSSGCCPAWGCSRPAASLSKVVLPQPLRPTRQWNSPLRDAPVDAAHHRRPAGKGEAHLARCRGSSRLDPSSA